MKPGRPFQLFLSFFRITGITFGGGMAMLPLMEEDFVRRKKWLSDDDFLEIVSLVNTMPGVIAVNAALMIGRRTAGWPGAALACLGGLLPPFCVILLLAPVIAAVKERPQAEAAFRAARAAVSALVLLLVLRQARRMKMDWRGAAFALVSLAAVRLAGIHPIWVILVSGLAGFYVFAGDSK